MRARMREGTVTPRIAKGAKVAWVVATLSVLVVALAAFDGKPNSDAEELLAWPMLALGFPLTLAYPALFTGIVAAREGLGLPPIQTSYVELAASWCALFALGYLQWFKFVPGAAKRVRAFRQARSAKSARPPSPPSSVL